VASRREDSGSVELAVAEVRDDPQPATEGFYVAADGIDLG
jgi:hypothetical protein